jgi:quercetin dioxygenase-like cupin family protein
VRTFSFSREHAEPIELYNSVAASSVRLGDGTGEAHVYCIHFEPGGQIGAHPAGPGQLFLVVQGAGWAAGADGERVVLQAGQGAFFAPGELHSKGSEGGMTAIMVQVTEPELVAPPWE